MPPAQPPLSPPRPTLPRARKALWSLWRLWPVGLLGVAALLLVAAWGAHMGWAWPDSGWLQQRQTELRALHAAGPWAFALGLFLLFTLMSALALPGCSVLALAAGMAMGWVAGTALVALASTAGATVSFLAARHLWRDRVRQRWGHRLVRLQAGLARDGAYYLFSLRMAPVIPYSLINPLMGLSSMSTREFFVVSLLGMLAGSAAYVYAGTVLGQAQGWADLASPTLWLALVLLALLPWAARWCWRAGWRVAGPARA